MLLKKTVGLFLSLICLLQMNAQAPKHTPRFSPFIDDNINGFWEYLPRNYSIDVSKRYPLLIFIHGSGEQGQVQDLTTLNLVLRNGPPKIIQSGSFPDSFRVQGNWYKFIVISPQIKIGLYGASSIISPSTIEAIIRYAKGAYRIDSTKIYLSGLSMGGGATWDYAGSSLDAASRLAAVVIACGAGDVSQDEATNIARANLPVLATHNWDDPLIAASRTQASVGNILAYFPQIHPTPKVIYWASGGHNAWRRTFENIAAGSTPGGNVTDTIGMNMYQWMLQFNRLQLALPLSWQSVSIQKKDQMAVIEWTLDIQESVDHYTIERSKDATRWTRIGTMPAKTERRNVQYVFIDNHPEKGKSFYRIDAEDINGTINYSSIKEINFEMDAYAISVYPNPFGEQLSFDLQGIQESFVTLRITDATGRLVSSTKLAVNNHSTKVNGLSNLQTGLYSVSIHSRGKQLYQQKLIKE